MWELICLLLPVAAYSGWQVGRKGSTRVLTGILPDHYYTGLNHLLNEQPDKAVDAFTRLLDDSPETVETTVALGALFRRRGEVDKAIQLHQELVLKPSLTRRQKQQALFALGEDYLYAGMYDRAEALFCELKATPSLEGELSLKHLLEMYEKQKEWEKALEMAQERQQRTGIQMTAYMAHYYCELALKSLQKGNHALAHSLVKKALLANPLAPRPSLLEAELELQRDKPKTALRALKRIQYQDATFIPDTLAMLERCYEALGAKNSLMTHLEDLLHYVPNIQIALFYHKILLADAGTAIASEFINQFVMQYPCVRGIQHLVHYHLERASEKVRRDLTILQTVMAQLQMQGSHYRCEACGFSANTLDWQCPSCRRWDTVKPTPEPYEGSKCLST